MKANTAGYGSNLTFSTTKNGVSINEAMRIDENGNVGIGTTSPGSKLEVAGNLGIGADTGLSSIYRRTVNGSNGVRISGNTSSTLNDANPGASILL